MNPGIFYMLVSAVFFAASTGVAKYINSVSDVSAIQITFGRFFLGSIMALFFMLKHKVSFRPVNSIWIFFRVISNTAAVILFFYGIAYSTVTESNMLNMTYPVFVFMIAPFINSESAVKEHLFYLFLSMFSILLILNPAMNGLNFGNILSIFSAVFAAVGVSVLRESRKHDGSFVILFYMMTAGLLLNILMMLPYYKTVSPYIWLMIMISGFLAVIGQFAITYGAKYITASAGSIISTTRIFWAAVIGIVFFDDELKWNTFCGGVLLFVSVAGIGGGWRNFFRSMRSVKE